MRITGDDFFLYNFCWKKLSNENILSKHDRLELKDPLHDFVRQLMEEGKEFERRVISELEKKGKVAIIRGRNEEHKYQRTIKAMKEGAEIIYQGVIKDDEKGLMGIPDLLIKGRGKSKFGDYQYHPADIKSSHDPKGEQILQVILYKKIMKELQEAEPQNSYIYNQSRNGKEIYDIYSFEHANTEKLQKELDRKKQLLKNAKDDIEDIGKLIASVRGRYKKKAKGYYDKRKLYKNNMFRAERREDKYSAAVKLLDNQIKIVDKSNELEEEFPTLLEDITKIKTGEINPTPTISAECKMCDYEKSCYDIATFSREVSLVAGTGRVAKRNLADKGVDTIEELLEVEDISALKSPGFGEKKIQRLITNALGWKENRLLTYLDNKLIEEYGGAPLEKPGLKKPNVGIQVDFEADEETGRMVMIGINAREGRKKPYGMTFFAETPKGELQMLKDFMHYMEKVGDNVQLYHWSQYEKTHFKNMFDRHYKALLKEFGNKYFDIEDRIMDNLVDLYPMAVKSFAGPIHGYSIKTLLPKCFDFQWREDTDIGKVDGAKFEVLYTKYQNLHDGPEKDHIKKVMFEYNQDDVIGPWRVADKLYELSRRK